MFLLTGLLFINLLLVYIGFRFTKNIFKKNSLRITIWTLVFIGLFILEVLGSGFFIMQGFKASPKNIFKEYLANPIPKSVRIIEGGGFAWLGWGFHLVFTADPATIENILAKYPSLPDCIKIDPYEKIPKNIKEEVKLVFKKEDITRIPNLTCYYKYTILGGHELDSQKVTNGEEIYIFWDKQRNRVFFCCSGGS